MQLAGAGNKEVDVSNQGQMGGFDQRHESNLGLSDSQVAELKWCDDRARFNAALDDAATRVGDIKDEFGMD